jgi:hypothetical protein
MDFESQLAVEISKRNTDFITSTINGCEDKFRKVWNIMFTGEPPTPHRASWVVSTCFDRWPYLVHPYLSDMIEYIPYAPHTGIKRSLLKILAQSNIPELKMGELLNICFEYMENDMPVAVKVHAMQIIYNISEKEPDIKPELITVIEDQLPRNSTGFQNRGSKLLKKLYEETGLR